MKKNLLKALTLVFIVFYQAASAQVTLISNNTNLTSGVSINGHGILISKNDSIWVTDGTPGGTLKLVNNVAISDTSGVIFNNKAYFTGVTAADGAELWASDGTAGATTLIKNINPGAASSFPNDFYVFNNNMYFAANNGTDGVELWKSDGTTDGTILLKNINPNAGANGLENPTFFENNGLLFFTANDGTNGVELWKTDGTTLGTSIVKNITAGSASSSITAFTSIGTTTIFNVIAGSSPLSTLQLWKTDGTDGGTSLIKDFGLGSGFFPSGFYKFNNKVYFVGVDALNTGAELWVTDATTDGTVLVKDINPGSESSLPILFNAVTINDKFYFSATTQNEGTELWRSNGTEQGTELFMNINSGANDSDPFIFKPFDFNSQNGFFSDQLYNGKIFFSADDGSHGKELWITNGTPDGTKMVKDIRTGVNGSLGSGLGYFYTSAGLFFSANDGSGNEPWKSDGTFDGTALVADVNPGTPGSSPEFMFIHNNRLYFNANNGDDASNVDLYKIDATVSTLPLSLLNFSATVQQTNSILLNWNTSNEINSSHFKIERSTDAKNFAAIGEVNAAGNTTRKQEYNYLDRSVSAMETKVLYYRLKSVDKDGIFKYSGVLTVHLNSKALQFTFAPNPVVNELKVMIEPAGAKKIALRITDQSGKTVLQQTLPAGQTVYTQNINVSALQKGTYYLELVTDKTTRTEKFVKQ